MTNEEIIKLGTTLGLRFNENDNYKDMLARNNVVFNGINGQRFRFEGGWTDDEILTKMGCALQLMGRRQLKLELESLLNIMTDN